MAEDTKTPETKEPAKGKGYTSAPWRHKKSADGRVVPPGRTMVYRGPTSEGAVICETEEEYKDHLNRGYKDTMAPEAWQ